MSQNEYYSASELAEKLHLPRTTVNDWLKTYSGYIESDLRGKRRVYPDATLEILKLISDWRTSGRNSHEIADLLAAQYGIRPEIDHASPAAEEQMENPSSDIARVTTNQLARREQSLEEAINEFRELALKREKAAFRRRFWGWLVVLVILGVAGAAIWYGSQFLSIKLSEQDAMLKNHNLAQEQFAREINEAIDRGTGDYQEKIKTLQNKINSLDQTIQKSVDELKKSVEEQEKNEIFELKKKVEALEQQLKQLEAAKAQSELQLQLEKAKNAAPIPPEASLVDTAETSTPATENSTMEGSAL